MKKKHKLTSVFLPSLLIGFVVGSVTPGLPIPQIIMIGFSLGLLLGYILFRISKIEKQIEEILESSSTEVRKAE